VRKHSGRSNDGKNTQVEDTAPFDDVYDVAIGLAGSGVVYDSTFPQPRTSSTSECSHGGHDRCICGMDGA
jgi:hypothetical protein